jgi:hypothetical protein
VVKHNREDQVIQIEVQIQIQIFGKCRRIVEEIVILVSDMGLIFIK